MPRKGKSDDPSSLEAYRTAVNKAADVLLEQVNVTSQKVAEGGDATEALADLREADGAFRQALAANITPPEPDDDD